MSIGPIAALEKNAGGTGYAVGDTGYLIQGGNTPGTPGGNGTYIVDTEGSGVILTFTMTNAGTGYDTDVGTSELSTTPGGGQPGAGDGFTWDLLAVAPTTGGGGLANAFH